MDIPPFQIQFRLPLLADLGLTGFLRVPFNQFAGGTRKTLYYGVRVTDSNGNVTQTVSSYDIIPDNAPIIDIIAPRPGAYFPEGIAMGITAQVADDVSVDSVDFIVNDATGQTIYTANAPPFAYGYRIPANSGGEVTISASALDSFGNRSSAPAIRINTREDYPPSISISNPINGQDVREGRNLLIQAAAGDDIAVRSVTFYVDGEPVRIDTTAPFEMSWDVPFGRLGNAIILGASATDTAGRSTFADQIRVNVAPDGTAPTVTFQEPADNSGIIAGSVFRVRATAQDDVSLSSVVFHVNGSATPHVVDLAAPYEFLYRLPANAADAANAAGRWFTFTATAYDAAGNASVPASLTIEAVRDLAPVISSFTPVDQSTIIDGSLLLLAAVADDDVDVVSVEFFVDGKSVGRDHVLPFNQPFQMPLGRAGTTMTFKAVAKDTAGQTTEKVSVVNVSEDEPPLVELDLPLPG
ncbi:MAG TPA: Ig-like domain-containing protein, partial [Opitutus sp.]|nr:Ig-like domain-containing protein [Opitutus sp.]